MKKGLLTLFAALTFFAASAQIEKGAILVNGQSSLDFTSSKPDGGDSFSEITLGLKGGYFFIDNLAVGPQIVYYKHSEADDALTGFGLFGRYYVNGKIILGAGFNSNKAGDASWTTVPLEAGYAAFVTDNVAIEPVVSYELWSGDQKGSAFGLSVGISVYLNRGE
jgi:hypothetical protein